MDARYYDKERMPEGYYSPFKQPLTYVSEKPLQRKGRNAGHFRESTKYAKGAKTNAESELYEVKKTVKDLAFRIEESNSRVKRIEKLEKQENPLHMWDEETGSPQREIHDAQYAEVIREVEQIKEEVSKLKVDMAFVLQGKRQAEKEAQASSFRFHSYSSSMEAFRKEIDELNEEHAIVELARIEALREYGATEVEKKEEAEQYSASLEETKNKISGLIEETNRAKVLEAELDITTSDVDTLNRQLVTVRTDMQKQESSKHLENNRVTIEKEELESQSFLQSVLEELEVARKELATINEEGFQFMASMEVVRDEIKHLVEEKARLRETEEKADLTIQSLNSKLLRAKSKLEEVSAAEEKASSISSSLSVSLEQLKTEVEAARRERELICEETAKIKAEIPKTESEIDLAEAKLEATMQELTTIKSSEAVALENLKSLVEESIRARATTSHPESTITISTFEYEYLKGRAAGAEELADKKVAAAQAWIEALKASEKEILMKIEIKHREIREVRMEKEHRVNRKKQIISAKKVREEEVWDGMEKQDNTSASEKLQLEKKSLNRNGISSPRSRPKIRKSGSPAGWQVSRSTSVTVDRRRKGV